MRKNVKDILRQGSAELLDIIFPRKCPVCGRLTGKARICPGCARVLRKVRPPVCRSCGTALVMLPGSDNGRRDRREAPQAGPAGWRAAPQAESAGQKEAQAAGPAVSKTGVLLCPACRARHRAFDGVRSVFLYENPAKEMLLRLKYHHAEENAAVFAELCREPFGALCRAVEPDCLIPVPVHKKRLKQRGYNQAELLARELAQGSGSGNGRSIPVCTDWVYRTGSTKAQKELTPADRVRNLKNAFAPGPGIKKSSTVLLIDDIYTTGSTLEAISRVLKASGVRSVYGFTVCTGEAAAELQESVSTPPR